MRKRDQPHDRYFKDSLQDVEVIKKFLHTHLEQDILQEIQWDSLTPYDTSLIGAKGKQLYADVLYRALTKDSQAEMFFMFNHERKPSELLGIRVEEYILGTVRKSVRQRKQRPIFILCFTIYNGLRQPYPYPHSLIDYFANRELAKKILFNSHRLIDLSAYSDEELSGHGTLGAIELLMKHIDNPNLPDWIRSHPSIIQKLESGDHLTRSIDYLVEAGHHSVEDLLALFEEISPKFKEGMLTTRQQIEKQGLRKGRQEGMQQGMQAKSFEIARYMLKDQTPKEKVSMWTGSGFKAVKKFL